MTRLKKLYNYTLGDEMTVVMEDECTNELFMQWYVLPHIESRSHPKICSENCFLHVVW